MTLWRKLLSSTTDFNVYVFHSKLSLSEISQRIKEKYVNSDNLTQRFHSFFSNYPGVVLKDETLLVSQVVSWGRTPPQTTFMGSFVQDEASGKTILTGKLVGSHPESLVKLFMLLFIISLITVSALLQG